MDLVNITHHSCPSTGICAAMATKDIAFLRATPVLRTGDYARARDFYRDKLGYQVVEEGGEPPRFGIFDRGNSTLFINGWPGPPASPSNGAHWDAYVHLSDADAAHAAFSSGGVTITRAPEDTVYRMREFEITDPDGNTICFGQDLDQFPRRD